VARGRKTGGRLKGSKNKRTLERERATQEAARQISAAIKGAFEGDAHDLLMAVYKDPDQPLHVRIDAAKAALPYEKPRVLAEPKKPEGPMHFTFEIDGPVAEAARERREARIAESSGGGCTGTA
jgi:hypothetical protein